MDPGGAPARGGGRVAAGIVRRMRNRAQTEAGRRGGSQRYLSPVLLVALLLGVTAHLAGFLVFRVVSNPLPERQETQPYVAYLSARSMASDEEMEARVALQDSAPLFIPTRWNASRGLAPPEYPEVERFPDFEPSMDPAAELEAGTAQLTRLSRPNVETPADLLNVSFWNLFGHFGRGAAEAPELPDAGPFARVTLLAPAFSAARPGSTRTVEAALGGTIEGGGTGPAVFRVWISGAGRVRSPPRLTQSSGSDALDEAAADWLGRPATAARLPGGYLEVAVFPGGAGGAPGL